MPNTKLNRSAKTGKIISAKAAKRRPGTTVTETVTAYQRHRKEVLALLLKVSMNGGRFVLPARKLYKKITGEWPKYGKYVLAGK